ncbi:RHS repeat-associated core domain-containing protein, partial [Anaerostipes hominis (ex Liu et al. 2021)]
DFGETQSIGENTAKNETCYTGGRYDETTGLYYLNARYYNPEDGRFLSEDTYRGETNEPDTQHLYGYCADNPINYVDPSGHAKEVSWGRNTDELRICTDGVIKNKYERKKCHHKKGPYGDLDHQCGTRCFNGTIASDDIPYIVVPKNMKAYIYSVGVIVNMKNGNYLFGVVAELGPNSKGLGEVSIYAGWRMKQKGMPSKNKRVPGRYQIGNSSVGGRWLVNVYRKSAPNSSKSGYGWKYKNASKFRKQIKQVGKKYYKPPRGRGGRCLN